jgi:hypothetical protein
LPLAALMLILDRYPDWQQSQWIVALGIFSSITSTIAAYEFVIKRFIHQNEADGKPGQIEIINGKNRQITGGQQGITTQQNMREQTVQGHQVNIAGDAKGPIFINAAAKLSPPLQKPPRSQHFIGREVELASLLRGLRPGRAVTICGPRVARWLQMMRHASAFAVCWDVCRLPYF